MHFDRVKNSHQFKLFIDYEFMNMIATSRTVCYTVWAVTLGHKWCFGVWPRSFQKTLPPLLVLLAWLPPEETLKKDPPTISKAPPKIQFQPSFPLRKNPVWNWCSDDHSTSLHIDQILGQRSTLQHMCEIWSGDPRHLADN